LTKYPEARVIGIRAPGRWAGERVKRHGQETYIIKQCDSPLALRIALRRMQDQDQAEDAGLAATTVLITSLDDAELSDDIRLRLAKRRLIPIDSWQIVKSLFQAHAIDPRLSGRRWIADALMEFTPEGNYPAVAGGFLDAETVWPILLTRVIGLANDRPDLAVILRWSIEAGSAARFREASPEFRAAASAWLADMAGNAASTVLGCVAANPRPDALAVGLAAGVVYHVTAKGKLEKAAGKMEERFLGRSSPDAATVERWSAMGAEVVRLQITDSRLKQSLLDRADEILRQVVRELSTLFGVDRATFARWQAFWRDCVPKMPFWKLARARLVPVVDVLVLRLSLLEAFHHTEDPCQDWGYLLRFLSPLTVPSSPLIKMT
jgi:hypothetical protein